MAAASDAFVKNHARLRADMRALDGRSAVAA